jgi:excisionase family DNA binding protein
MNTKRTAHQDGFLSKQDAAAYLSLSPRTLDNLVARGDLLAFKVTRKVLFRMRDLDALAERHRVHSRDDVVEELMREVHRG